MRDEKNEKENPLENLPSTGDIKTKYTMQEINSQATLFETWHKEAHSFKVKYVEFKQLFKKHKESIAISIQAAIIIYLRVWGI